MSTKQFYAVMAGLDPAIHEGAARRLTPSPFTSARSTSSSEAPPSSPYPRSLSCAVAARRK